MAARNISVMAQASSEDALAAIKSLYDDQLKPYGRILRKRLVERARKPNVDFDLGQLRAVCEALPTQLTVLPENGGEWCALFEDCPADFVDVYSPNDPYPEDIWQAASAHFRQLTGKDAILPGGRYSCAQALMVNRLSFLRGRSLGEVCHIVQLAISQRKVLGYLNGAITPYSSSHSMLKDRAAAQTSSCSDMAGVGRAGKPSKMQLATWEVALRCLQQIMEEAGCRGSFSVPISNIKRIFRSRFHMELSETALGHSKLSELLQDDRLCDVCTVRLLEQGYFVVPCSSASHPAASTTHSDPEQVVPEVSLSETDVSRAVPRLRAPRALRTSETIILLDDCVRTTVQNTFIHAGGPSTQSPSETRRPRSVPKDMGSRKAIWFASQEDPAEECGSPNISRTIQATAEPATRVLLLSEYL